MKFQIILFIILIGSITAISQFDKKEIDQMVQSSFSNQMLEIVQNDLLSNRGQSTILDHLDEQIEDVYRENQADKEQFNKENSECQRLLSSTKQDQKNKQSEKENLESKPDTYNQEINDVEKLIRKRMDIINRKDVIMNDLKTNRDNLHDKYYRYFQQISDTERFFEDMMEITKELIPALKIDEKGKVRDLCSAAEKVMTENEEIEHPYVPLVQTLKNVFIEAELTAEEAQRIENVISNLYDDMQGSEESFDELQQSRTSNFKNEYERLATEIDVAKNSITQLRDYQEYLRMKIQNIQDDVSSIDKRIDNSDQEILTQRAHCEGESSRFNQRESQRESQVKTIRTLAEMLETDFKEVSDYVKQLDIKLYQIGYIQHD